MTLNWLEDLRAEWMCYNAFSKTWLNLYGSASTKPHIRKQLLVVQLRELFGAISHELVELILAFGKMSVSKLDLTSQKCLPR